MEGADLQFHSFLISTLVGSGCCFFIRKMNTLHRILYGFQKLSGPFGEEKKFLPLQGIYLRTVQCSVVNSDIIYRSLISVVKVLRVIVASCPETFKFKARIFSEIVLA